MKPPRSGAPLLDAPRVQEIDVAWRTLEAPMSTARHPRTRTSPAGHGRQPIRSVFGESRGVTVLVGILLLLLLLLLVRPMLRSALSYQRTAAMLEERRAEVASLQERNRELLQRRDYYRTSEFIAERAREYGLVRPGEESFVIRELVHPELIGRYARAQLANAAYEDAALGVPATPGSNASTRR